MRRSTFGMAGWTLLAGVVGGQAAEAPKGPVYLSRPGDVTRYKVTSDFRTEDESGTSVMFHEVWWKETAGLTLQGGALVLTLRPERIRFVERYGGNDLHAPVEAEPLPMTDGTDGVKVVHDSNPAAPQSFQPGKNEMNLFMTQILLKASMAITLGADGTILSAPDLKSIVPQTQETLRRQLTQAALPKAVKDRMLALLEEKESAVRLGEEMAALMEGTLQPILQLLYPVLPPAVGRQAVSYAFVNGNLPMVMDASVTNVQLEWSKKDGGGWTAVLAPPDPGREEPIARKMQVVWEESARRLTSANWEVLQQVGEENHRRLNRCEVLRLK